MSKGLKKLRKVAATFDLGHRVGKSLGLPDPSGDALYGKNKALTPAEQAQKQARDLAQQQAEIAQQQMNMQLAAANQQAQQGAQQIQLSQDREAAMGQLNEAGKLQEERPTIELADSATQTTRKKFRGQIGGGGKSPSVRV